MPSMRRAVDPLQEGASAMVTIGVPCAGTAWTLGDASTAASTAGLVFVQVGSSSSGSSSSSSPMSPSDVATKAICPPPTLALRATFMVSFCFTRRTNCPFSDDDDGLSEIFLADLSGASGPRRPPDGEALRGFSSPSSATPPPDLRSVGTNMVCPLALTLRTLFMVSFCLTRRTNWPSLLEPDRTGLPRRPTLAFGEGCSCEHGDADSLFDGDACSAVSSPTDPMAFRSVGTNIVFPPTTVLRALFIVSFCLTRRTN
mmetsp:Transcript_8466/g.19468  ORF Transcript_8466/g.19468 Transcript_8466/m.19468 type:complete len:257 (-) Transcript_8466:962-1732(-)